MYGSKVLGVAPLSTKDYIGGGRMEGMGGRVELEGEREFGIEGEGRRDVETLVRSLPV